MKRHVPVFLVPGIFSSLHGGLIFGLLFFQTTHAQEIPDSPQGRIAKAYVEAFNGGEDETMRSFFRDHLAAEAQKLGSMEDRVERTRTIRSRLKSLQPVKAVSLGKDQMEVAVKAGNGEELSLIFTFEPNAPYRMVSLRMEAGEKGASDQGSPLSRDEFLAEAEQYLSDRVREDRFSGTVLIARGRDILFQKAYGVADKRFDTPNRVDTKFNLGSINKLFTRIALAQLLEKNKLSLNDPIGKIVADYPNKDVARKVQVRHLLNMSSGLGDFFGDKYERTAKDRIRSLTDYLPLFVDDSLLFEPGTENRYSNAGFVVLGLIIEKISRMSYYDYVKANIFEPAGMPNSGWYDLDAVTPNLATGYTHREEGSAWTSNIYSAPRKGSSAGGGYSTTNDLFNFLQALRHGQLLSPRYTEYILTGVLPSKDGPLPLSDGNLAIGGGAVGINAVIEFEAGTGHTVIVLSNYDPPSAGETARHLSGLMDRWKQ